MAEQITIGFYSDTDTKALLEKWAEEDDRSVSSIIRKLIEAERARRVQTLTSALTPPLSHWEREEEVTR